MLEFPGYPWYPIFQVDYASRFRTTNRWTYDLDHLRSGVLARPVVSGKECGGSWFFVESFHRATDREISDEIRDAQWIAVVGCPQLLFKKNLFSCGKFLGGFL